MEKYLPFLNGVTITAALGWFLWWKGTLHKEIVKPDIDSINKRIDFLESRVEKTEELYDRIQDNIERKLDKMSDQIGSLTEKVAQLSGELKARKTNE